MYEISVIVLTYNQEFEKTKLTLNSIIAQENIELEIIVSDDGSENDCSLMLKDYFKSKGFFKYRININKTNLGTIGNALSAVALSNSDIVKIISPGDFLAEKNTLKKWIEFKKRNNSKIVFGDVIYYKTENKKVHVFKAKAMPQNCQIFDDKSRWKIIFSYLGLRDQIHGVSMIVERELFKNYLEELYGLGMKFCEDTFVHLAVLYNDSIKYFPKKVVWYEYGYGISNLENTKGNARIEKDMDLFYKYLAEGATQDEFLRSVKDIVMFQKKARCDKLLFLVRNWALMKYYVLYRVKLLFGVRMTSMPKNLSWFYEIADYHE